MFETTNQIPLERNSPETIPKSLKSAELTAIPWKEPPLGEASRKTTWPHDAKPKEQGFNDETIWGFP